MVAYPLNDLIADNLCSANNTGVKDRALRSFSLWTAALAGGVALIGFVAPQIEPLIVSSTLFLAALAALLFFRVLFSRFYREGVDFVNRAMQGDEAWPGGPVDSKDPEWGLFGQRTGNLPLLWVRAILVLGILPAYVLQHVIGGQSGWLWFLAAFIVMELSIMHAAIDAQSRKA